MNRPDNIPLPNLSLKSKIIYSSLLLIGIATFIATWASVLYTVYWREEEELLGIGLAVLAAENKSQFYTVFFLHSVGMAVLLGAAYLLFKKTSLRRRIKFAIAAAAVVLGILDISAWQYSPQCSASNMYVGLVGALAAIPLLTIALTPLWQMWFYKRWRSPDQKLKRVVIVGGGFAGLYAAMGLNQKLGYNRDLEITVIDKNNFFLFPPLLPSAAAGTIESRQVSYPFRRIFETTNIIFRKVEVTEINPKSQTVQGIVEVNIDPITGNPMTVQASFPYDFLVLAPGSITQTFKTAGAEINAYFMRELSDAIEIRDQVIECFECAAALSNEADRRELLRFVIIGGGPTGIETATEIHDLIHHVLLKRYPEISAADTEVCVVQSGPQILPGWNQKIVDISTRQLKKLGVRLCLESRVAAVGPSSVTLAGGELLATRTAIWCAGVKPAELLERSGLALDKSGRVIVREDLRSQDFENVFVIGDTAYLVDKKSNRPLPPLGQVAFQQGSHTAKNLVRILAGQQPLPFKYFDFGALVSVGEHFAAVNLLGIKISGIIGWLIWRSLYLAKLPGISNRLRVVVDWTLDLLIERSITQLGSGSNRHTT